MVALIDDAHTARAEFFFQTILAEAAGLDGGFLGFALESSDDEREHENGAGAESQQTEHRVKRPMQDGERAIGFGVVDFGDDADVVLGQPSISADCPDTAIVVVGVYQHARSAGDGGGGNLSQRLLGAANFWSEAARHVAAGIANRDVENGLGAVCVGQQSDLRQLVVETAAGNHEAVFIDGVCLTRFAEAAHLEDLRELLLGADAQGQGGDDALILVVNRSSDEHRGNAAPRNSVFVLQDDNAGKWRTDGDTAFEGGAKERFVLRNCLAKELGAGRGNDALLLVSEDVADEVMSRHAGGQLLREACLKGWQGSSEVVGVDGRGSGASRREYLRGNLTDLRIIGQ